MEGKMRFLALFVGLALASASAGVAQATEEVLFTIKGGDPTATFELPLSPIPGIYDPGYYFVIYPVPVNIGGSPQTADDILFGSSTYVGGFDLTVTNSFGYALFNDSGYGAAAPLYYSGPESSPTFIPGVYSNQYNYSTGQIDTVTVTTVGAPEPSTWAMMLLGFAGLSFAGYQASRKSAAIAA
jgi:hypothetical protein